jgi:TonB family protein
MKKENFIVHPYYEGGNAAMEKRIVESLKYPENALIHHVEGTVSLKYNIDIKGHVIAAKIIAGIGHGCDEEAIRLVKLLKFIVPRQPKGLKVIFNKEIHIHFRIPKVAPQPIKQPEDTPTPPPQYSYSYRVSTIKKEIKTTEKPVVSYSMTVKIKN